MQENNTGTHHSQAASISNTKTQRQPWNQPEKNSLSETTEQQKQWWSEESVSTSLNAKRKELSTNNITSNEKILEQYKQKQNISG